MSSAVRADLESLLRARKLDVTLTSAAGRALPDDRLAPTGVPALDRALGGGLRRGHLSEVVGERSTGRTTLVCRVMAAAAERGEIAARGDPHVRVDPRSAAATGVDLSRLLWIRDRGDASRALKAMNLVLQAGGFGVVVFDLADVRGPAVRSFPPTTWMRLSRVIEGGDTVALLVGRTRLARSPGGVTVALEAAAGDVSHVRWNGTTDRSRLLGGLAAEPRVISSRGPARAAAEGA